MSRSRLLALFAALALPAVPAFAQEYTVTTGDTLAYVPPPEELLSEASPHGKKVILGPGRDAEIVPVTLPFTFPFFGTLYTRISVADDGWFAFGTAGAVVPTNPELATAAAPNAVVAPLWDALETGARGSVVTHITSTAPNREFVITWDGVRTSNDTKKKLSFQVRLIEASSAIEFAYSGELDQPLRGVSATVGIENRTGTTAFPADGTSNLIVKLPPNRRFTPNTVTVTGTISRSFPTPAATGLPASDDATASVAGIDVQIVREDAGEVAATGRTKPDGTFAIDVRGVLGTPLLAVDLLASGAESRVTDGTGAVYKRRIASGLVPAEGGVTVPPVTLDAAVDAVDPAIRKAVAIQQAAQKGFALVQGYAGADKTRTSDIPQVEIRWERTVVRTTGYSPASGSSPARIVVSDAPLNTTDATNSDAYDTALVLREYGLHVLATLASPPGALSAHTFAPGATVTQTETLGFADGFSFWFAGAVLGTPKLFDTKTGQGAVARADVFDLETATQTLAGSPISAAVKGANAAGAVAASLWDLCDAKVGDTADDDPFDGELPGAAYAVLAAVDQRKGEDTLPTGSTPHTIRSVFDAFTKNLAPEAPQEPEELTRAEQASKIFIGHQTLPDDTTAPRAYEPNDVATDAKPLPDGASKQDGLTLNPFNTDFIAFKGTGTVRAVSVSFADESDVEVTIFSKANPTSPLGSAASTIDKASPVVAASANALDDGTDYVARVKWKGGATAHYTIAFGDKPVLTTTVIPPATAEQTYTAALNVSGGIAPVSLSIDPAIPGLTLGGTNNQLSGRPTTPGTYVFEVFATDASNSGPRLAGTLTLVVNPRLELVRTFAVRSGAAVDADVGRGGTDAAWTDVSAVPAEGVTVAGGGTLHVTGSAPASKHIEVKGSATDARGAKVTNATCDVVFCPPLADATRTPFSAEHPFGYSFGALAGSRASITVRFAGTGAAPGFRAIVDDAGHRVALPDDAVDVSGSGVRISGVTLPRTSRYFVVFDASAGFKGRVGSARAAVKAPRRVSGVANITAEKPTATARFSATRGAHVRVAIRAAQVPSPGTPPTSIQVQQPGPGEPAPQTVTTVPQRGGVVAEFDVDATGEVVVTIGASPMTTGPLTYEIVISPPKGDPLAE